MNACGLDQGSYITLMPFAQSGHGIQTVAGKLPPFAWGSTMGYGESSDRRHRQHSHSRICPQATLPLRVPITCPRRAHHLTLLSSRNPIGLFPLSGVYEVGI